MHSYEGMKKRHGTRVVQTIDTPIMIFDYWELGDAFLALLVILVFGVVFYEWVAMLAMLGLVVVLVPAIRRRGEKGVFFHWPYRRLGMSLPGLVNPRGRRAYSD